MFLEQKTLVTISCRFFKSHSIFVLAIFLRPYMIEVSKKIANSKIEWQIKNLQLIVTNLFHINNPQNDPLNGQKYKKINFLSFGTWKRPWVFTRTSNPFVPLVLNTPHTFDTPKIPSKHPKKPPKSPKSQKIKFLCLGTR